MYPGSATTEASPHTILVVDDEENSRELIRRKLKNDYRVLMADSGRAAIDLVGEQPVDLVILDVMMPELSGYDVCSVLKKQHTDTFLPVVLLTALNEQGDRNRGLAAGADEFLTKPVNSRELRLRINGLLRIREQEETIRAQSHSLEQANTRLRAINDLGALMSSNLQCADPYGLAVTAIAREFDLDLAAIGTVDGDAPATVSVTPDGARDRADELFALPACRIAIETGGPQSTYEEDGLEVCWNPIRDRQGPIGVLMVGSKRRNVLLDAERRTISTISLQLAMALRNHEFIGEIRARSEGLEAVVRERTASLERQIRFTHQIIDSLPVSLHVVDRERNVVAWNRKRELGRLGMPRERALGKNLHDLFQRLDRDEVETELERVFDRGERLCLESDSKEGNEIKHFRIHKLPMSVESGRVTHVLTIGEDITEQRRAEKSIRITERMVALGRLAAGVAHEVNNPLATIATCAEALRGRLDELPAGDDEVMSDFREYLQTVEQEAYRAKRITEDLLDFSRTKPSSRALHDLEEIIERTLLVLKHHAGFNRIDVERRFQACLPPVRVEEDAIVQVMVALIINALDAMPEGGRLRLATSSDDDRVRCEIDDTGCGISPEDRSRIFEPFFTTKPAGRGTGLGLAVCFGIIESHGGHIDVDSTPGVGSRFTVVLPAAVEPDAEPEDKQTCKGPIPSAC